MTIENILLIVAIILLFSQWVAIVQFFTLLYHSFGYLDFKQIEKDEVDKTILELFEPLEEFLIEKGFRYITMLEHENSIVGNTQKFHIAYYYNDKNATHAFVKTQPYRGALEPISIVYKTIFDDGKRIETVNGTKHFSQISPKNVSLHDHYLLDNEEIYSAHLKEVQKEQKSIKKEPFNKENIVAFKSQDEKEYIKSLEDAKIVKTDKNGYKFRFSYATWKFTKGVIRGHMRYAKILKQRKNNPITKKVELNTIVAQLEEMKKPQAKGNKLLWFGFSAVVFVTLFFMLGFSFVDIFILIAVLLLHELGHYLAMLYFGYKDTTIFFLPFGAATIGKKEHKKANEEFIVFLAGPLPGILVGIAILAWNIFHHNGIDSDSPLMMYAIMSLAINYINLLPIYPLDGGRILQLLLLYRYPKAQFYFYLLSLAILIATLVWLRDPVLLIFVVIVSLGAKQSYRISNFLAKLFTNFKPETLDKQSIINQILQDKRYSNETILTKTNLAKQILQIVQISKPSRKLVWLGMIFYLLMFVPIFGIWYTMPKAHISQYDKLPKEAKERLDKLYTKIDSLKALTKKPKETYFIKESMATIEKYLHDKDINRTIAKPVILNSSKVPKGLKMIYAWHNGITQFMPNMDLLGFEDLKNNHKRQVEYIREDEDENFTTPYRIFIDKYGYSGLAYHLKKEGIYNYDFYASKSKNIKSYYSFNHLLKIIAEAYKRGIYYHDYDGFKVDNARFAKLKKAYLSKEDKDRYNKLIKYLQKSAIAFKDLPYSYLKIEILWAMSETYDSSMIPFMKSYLSDKNKRVRQQAIHYLGKLGDRSVIPLLLNQLDDDPTHCKGCALSGLNYLVNKDDIALLKKIYPTLNDKKMWIRRNGYKVIGKIANISSLPILKKHFKKEQPACKLAIVEAFGRIGDKEALPLLKEYLKEIGSMDFSVSYKDRSRYKNPHPKTLKNAVKKAIKYIQSKGKET